MIEILRSGPLLTVQDLGRPGHAHLGVPRSGAADPASHRAANALVGNPPGAATLETTLLGCTLRLHTTTVVAVAGAHCEVFVGGVRAPWGAPFRVGPGQSVEVGAAVSGVRSYVAVRGGVGADPVLGSRSTDILSGLGPDPLRPGDLVPVPEPASQEMPRGLFGGSALQAPIPSSELVIGHGPRADWLAPEGWAALARAEWTVSADSNRVGLRLSGPVLPRARGGEIASEGMVVGAVQLPPSGQPVVFLADHPTTGGYPVIGVVEDVAAAAQARPGSVVRLRLAGSP